MTKLFRIALLGLFFAGVAACSKGGDENANNAQPAAEKAQHATEQAAPKGGYDPNADADSDC